MIKLKVLYPGVVVYAITTILFAFLPLALWGQEKYGISVSDITVERYQKNWLLIPKSADLRVEWQITTEDGDGRSQVVSPAAVRDLGFTYQVYFYEGSINADPEIKQVKGATSAIFQEKKVGSQYLAKVLVYTKNSELVSESGLATILVGRSNDGAAGASGEKDLFYYLNPGRWQLLAIGQAEIYDRSTKLGKLAFIFLALTSFLSFLVLLYYSTRTLYLGNIFPFKRTAGNKLWSVSLSLDRTYENRLTDKFKFVLKAWEMVASKSRQVADVATKNLPAGVNSSEKLASVDVACMEYWSSDGDKAIGTIEDIIAFPELNGESHKKNPEDLLTELVVRIETSFHDLIATNGNVNLKRSDTTNMEKLIDEIYEPVNRDEKLLPRMRKWVLRKGVFNLKKGLGPFPTSRIIRAGLEIHRMNGYRWLKPTEEVKRAFEDRASNEIENLRRKSKIDWFWNYGALAPLVGLFGTVTGITHAFQQLSISNASTNTAAMIQQLSSGIFEALWTTIFGLANGIFFVLVYYYYKHKLDWIYSKWEEIYISITEKV